MMLSFVLSVDAFAGTLAPPMDGSTECVPPYFFRLIT